MSTPRRYKVAISFSSKQLDWVKQLAARLVAHFGAKGIPPEAAVFYYPDRQDHCLVPGMHKELEEIYGGRADLVVAVWSNEYNASVWCTSECGAYEKHLIYATPSQRHRVCYLAWPPYKCRATDGARDILPDNFEELCKLVIDKAEAIQIGPLHRPNNLPHESLQSLFKGREDPIKELHGRLKGNPAAAQAIVQKQAIHGAGGIGKTRFAIEYAWQYANDYSALLFVVADSPQNLVTNLARLCEAKTLNLPEKDAKEQPVQVAAALRWLQENAGWLLILDNVDDDKAAAAVKQLQPHLGHGHVLITSRRSKWWDTVQELKLDVLKPDAAVAYLLEKTQAKRRKKPSDASDARTLATELGFLAALMEQAAAYIGEQHLSFADCLERLKTMPREVWEHDGKETTDYPDCVQRMWSLSYAVLDAPSRELLGLLAWLAPEPIPRALLEGAGYGKMLARLAGYSLVDWDADFRHISILRLRQTVTREKMSPAERKETLELALEAVNAYIPSDPPPDDVRSWGLWSVARPHVACVIEHASACGMAPNTRLMNELALYLKARVLYREAEPLYRRALAIDEKSFGPVHPRVAIDLNNLATLLQATNRLAEAEPLMRRALQIDEKSFGPEHPRVAIDLNNLAQLLQATNRLAEAEPLMRRALAIDEKSFGPEHPDVARDLNNLAQLLKATNRLAEAEPLMRRALRIDEKSFGPEHPNVAIRLNNLAGLLQATNRLAEAEPLMRRHVMIFRKFQEATGHEHPHWEAALGNYWGLLAAMGLNAAEIVAKLQALASGGR